VFTTIIQAAAGEDLEIHSLNNPALYRAGQHGLSQTFHGRDRYAPVAANAALQKMQHRLDLSDFGPLWPNPVLLDWAAPTRANNQAQGSVMHIDVYGNVITNIPNEWLSPYAPGSTVSVSGQRMTANTTATVATAYQEGEKGTLLLVPGSNHTAELAVNHGSARQALNIMVGDALCLTGDAPK
jgi:S-adenosylmethionine hydrolase